MVVFGAVTAAAAATATTAIAKLLPVSLPVSFQGLDLLLCAGDFRRLLGGGVHLVAHLRDGRDSVRRNRRGKQSRQASNVVVVAVG